MIPVIPRPPAAIDDAAMQLFDELSREHELIARVAGALRRYATDAVDDVHDARRFVTFFRTYAGAWHHEREEEVVIPALVSDVRLPLDRGPIAVLLDDHSRMGDVLKEMSDCCYEAPHDLARFRSLALDYTAALLAHIDVEESVFFPESEHRLLRNGVRDLPSRVITSEEEAAAVDGDELARHYPPMDDVLRGDGCVMCPSFHASCAGIEREWWNEWEWEEMDEHVAAS
jgi:hemerythrin-like domain-containing protein